MILITGFKPFYSNKINPSEEVVERLNTDDIYKVVLPVTYSSSCKIVNEILEKNNISFILSFGLAQKRKTITLERYAKNEEGASIKDEDGELITKRKINENKDNRYETKVNLTTLNTLLNINNIPCAISEDAGAFICNKVYFNSLSSSYNSLFVHLPEISEDFTLDMMLKATEIILDFIN